MTSSPDMARLADELRKKAFELPPSEQYRLAFMIAENVGCVLTEEAEHPDSPHTRTPIIGTPLDARTVEWQPIETAPKDGTKIWCWLYDTGIVLMHWMTAEQNAAADGSDEPEEYIACWVKSGDPDDDWSPKFWKPFDAIGVPAGVEWIGRRWRDALLREDREE